MRSTPSASSSAWYLEGRPPVTNLYSSAIFIGWGAVVLGLGARTAFTSSGLGSAVAALAGFVTLFIAHNLALGGDTMEMMRAVLDTNFWLATHVVVITLGYSATFVAGAARHWSTSCSAVPSRLLKDACRRRRPGQVAGPDGLRHRLLRHAVQLRRHRARRHLGRPILGPVLGLGPEGERRA